MQLLQQIGHGLSHLFYPHICVHCRVPLITKESILCLRCLNHLPQTDHYHLPENDTMLRLAGRFPFSHAVSFCYFTPEGLLQELLHQLKYHNKKEIGYFLGREFGKALHHQPWLSDIDSIIPVPLHPKKQARRGFNQSQLIAHGLSETSSIPVAADALIRIKNTESQTRKTRQERTDNMLRAFELTQDLSNKHILLLDDVLTTGATIESCAQVLLTAPQASVSVATIGLAL